MTSEKLTVLKTPAASLLKDMSSIPSLGAEI
jgi:hypothetical protein